ncbi:Putative transmembrane protein [Francisella salina]|uniref:Transmembrane protein n=1 Tax=Francisella salina TaxID=573569 RepID=A0ABM5MB58_FRAST|nr:Putative transmembrane protein [Francisella salina]
MLKKVALATSTLVSGLVYAAPSADFAKVEEQAS